MPESTQKEIEGKEFEAILGQGLIIPPQPHVLMEIEQLAGQAHVNVKAIAKLIAKDPALVASVFKVVNSPAMGLRRSIDSVDSAISLLGLKQVTNLLKSIAVRQALGGSSPAYEKFWERSGDIAQIAAAIAQKQISVCNIFPDQVYMAGLFQDCGVPILMQRFPAYCQSFRATKGQGWPDLEHEDNLLHTDHSVVGYLVGKQWRLPDFILRGIRHHHEILSVIHPARTIVAILQFSSHLYCKQNNVPDGKEWEASRNEILDELGIASDGLQEFEEDIMDSLIRSD